jgi:hypothetical protein
VTEFLPPPILDGQRLDFYYYLDFSGAAFGGRRLLPSVPAFAVGAAATNAEVQCYCYHRMTMLLRRPELLPLMHEARCCGNCKPALML